MVRDTVDPVADQQLAEFVVNSHRRNHPSRQVEANDADQGCEGVRGVWMGQHAFRDALYIHTAL